MFHSTNRLPDKYISISALQIIFLDSISGTLVGVLLPDTRAGWRVFLDPRVLSVANFSSAVYILRGSLFFICCTGHSKNYVHTRLNELPCSSTCINTCAYSVHLLRYIIVSPLSYLHYYQSQSKQSPPLSKCLCVYSS